MGPRRYKVKSTPPAVAGVQTNISREEVLKPRRCVVKSEGQRVKKPRIQRKPRKKKALQVDNAAHIIEEVGEDELQERRFNEEMQKLSNIKELLKLTDPDHECASGDECNDADPGDDNLFDSDDDPLAEPKRKGVESCPRPAPRKGRGGHKYLKRNLEVQVSQKEVNEMSLIIRSTMRQSLTCKRLKPNQYSETVNIANENDDRRKPSAQRSVATDMLMYRSLWSLLKIQNQWRNDNTSAYFSSPEMFERKLCQSNLKNGIAKQLYIEHISWLSIMCTEDHCNINDNGVLAWVPGFQAKYSHRYPALLQEAHPSSIYELNSLLQIATTKALVKVDEVLQSLIGGRQALLQLIDLVNKVYYDKKKICMEFEQIHDSLLIRSSKYDESSVWGLKPIRLALEPPYFKTEDGLMAAPMSEGVSERLNAYSKCFFKRDKQKWTSKDLDQLKACICETLYINILGALSDRYEMLMADCIRRFEQEMDSEGRFDIPISEPFKKKRGRPKKAEVERANKYGNIFPVITTLQNGAVVRSKVSPYLLAEWRTNEEKALKSKTYEDLVYMRNECVDWDSVANNMVLKSRKHRTAEDCELAWRHEVHPRVNDKRWGAEESRRLKDICTRVGSNWSAVAKELNTGKPERTTYQCFFRVRNRIKPPKKLVWNDALDKMVLEKLKEHPGNWRIVAASLSEPAATKRQVIERYKKTINPVLRNGAFTRVEDCLLLLTIQKLKPFLAREGHFGCLLAYLPWRCETTWRDRANNLFSDWIVPWTLEEDQMLLDLAKSMNRNWQKISEEFTSFKNRKGCLTRYKILMRRLKDERFNNSLEAYHEAYAMTRYNVFQYKHLKEILELLKKVRDHPLPEEYRKFVGLLRDNAPSDVRLQHMLLTFDREILESTINSLSRYVQTRDNYWRDWISLHGKHKRTFDRRTFHPENAQSVASALHIQRLELKKKEEILNLSDFENEIYKFFARFRRTKQLNEGTDRPYIPDAKTLAKWSAVSRLIATPLDKLKDVPVKRKWKHLQSDNISAKGSMGFKIQTKRRKMLRSKKRNATDRILKTGKLQRTAAVSEDGYILIPETFEMKSTKRRSEADIDPEYVAVLCSRNQLLDVGIGQPSSYSLRSCKRKLVA